MHGLISALKKSKLFTSIDVIDLIDEETVNLIKIRADVHERNKIFPSHRVNIDEVIEEIKAGMARGGVGDVHERDVDRKL